MGDKAHPGMIIGAGMPFTFSGSQIAPAANI
jgi:hypothetical protein